MNSLVGLTGTFGIGAGLAYLFDPDRGRRRRALASDQLVSVVHAAGNAADATMRGVLAAVGSLALIAVAGGVARAAAPTPADFAACNMVAYEACMRQKGF